ncbi:MAG TPA: winged helix DNA-binding domain-containing protein [Ktedonobacterales bacterium]
MTDVDVARRRLLSQRIAGERFGKPADVVRWMGAMQAQDYRQALWAIGVRMATPSVADVEAAIAERRIVQTWPMRGTLHFVAAEDAKWMLELLAPRRLAADTSRRRQLELDEETLARGADLIREALQGGGRLTRSAVMRLLEDAGISPKGQRGYHILWYLAQTGLICLGPLQNKQQTFVLLDEWVPAPRRLVRDEALTELAGRYFASHGPAAVDDFATWAGLTLADARAGLEAAKPGMRSEKRGAKEYWSAADAPDHEMHDTSGVYLLAGFDEYLLGYKDRGDVLAPEHAGKVVPGGNGIFFPIIVVGGQVAGTWKRTLKKSGVAITLRPFSRLDVSQERLVAAAQRYSDFLGVPLLSAES